MSVPVPPMPPFGAINSVVPFTYADNYTYLEILVEMRERLNDALKISIIQDAAIEKFIKQITDQVNLFVSKFVHHTVEDDDGTIKFAMLDGDSIETLTKVKLTELIEAIDRKLSEKTDNALIEIRGIVTQAKLELTEQMNAAERRINDAMIKLERETQEKLDLKENKHYHVVTDYGAKGDGRTDDTEAIRAAIKAAGRGGHIYFPKGTYLVTQGIETEPDQYFEGSSGSWGDESTANSAIKWDIREGAGIRTPYGCVFERLRFEGPGFGRSGVIGMHIVKYATVRDCSLFHWDRAIYSKENWYTELDRVKWYWNNTAIDIEYCYNYTIRSPHIMANRGDDQFARGITVREGSMITISGGSIEAYQTGIEMGDGCMVYCNGVYFETDKRGTATSRRGIRMKGYFSNLLVTGCQVYLTNHESFVDASGGRVGNSLTMIGNKYKGGANGTETRGYVVYWSDNNVENFRFVSLGEENAQSAYSVYEYRPNNLPPGAISADPTHFFPYRGGWQVTSMGRFIAASANGGFVNGAGTSLPPTSGEAHNRLIGLQYWDMERNKLVVFNGRGWVDTMGNSI